ncbi:hypothetical protein KR067_000508, partial [Drosophila pandora]
VATGEGEEESLQEHNRLRSLHGCPALKLSASLSKGCAEYAQELAENEKFEHSDHQGKYGENLYYTSSDPKKCVQDWYDEIKDYDFNKPEFSAKTGHFTAVVWKSSTEMGHGQAKSKSGNTYVVARYTPPGNMAGEFEKNVPRVS